MRVKNQQDFWAGVMFVAFGAFFAGNGMGYEFGTAEEMGAGYFPTVLGVIMLVFGLLIASTGLSAKATDEKIARFEWGVLLFILGPVVLFGLLLQALGLILSLVMLILTSSYASHEFSLKSALFNAAVLIVMCLLIFVWGLDLRFQLWPSFVGT